VTKIIRVTLPVADCSELSQLQ